MFTAIGLTVTAGATGLGVWWFVRNVRFGQPTYVYMIDSDGNETVVDVKSNRNK